VVQDTDEKLKERREKGESDEERVWPVGFKRPGMERGRNIIRKQKSMQIMGKEKKVKKKESGPEEKRAGLVISQSQSNYHDRTEGSGGGETGGGKAVRENLSQRKGENQTGGGK